MKGFIKIIAGRFKGKKIKVTEHAHLRPTPNRLRESLFNILQYDIKGAHCLDGFAGTGALGLEAFSRGAASVVFLESDTQVFQQLQLTLEDFNSDALDSYKVDCLDFLAQTNKQFDIIFLDPPFNKDLWKTCYQSIFERNILNLGGLLYIESPALEHLNEKDWMLLKAGKIGDVYFAIFQRILLSKP